MTTRSHGYRYAEQEGKSTAQIAALIRRDIKQAIADGLLPAEPKYSVRTRTYSGGAAIDVHVLDWPGAWMDCDGFHGHAPKIAGRGRDLCRNYFCAAALEISGETRPGAESHQKLTAEAEAAKMTLERIHGAYNHDGSDSMVDHFDVNYYGSVTFEDARSAQFRAAEAARKAARRQQVDVAAAGESRRVVVYGSKGKRTVHDAVDVDGRIRLVCGATLWRSSMVGDAAGRDLTCSRCQKRAAADPQPQPAAAEVAPSPEPRVMHTYEVLVRNRGPVVVRPGAKLVRVVQVRTSADIVGAPVVIRALYPDAVSYRAPDRLEWVNLDG